MVLTLNSMVTLGQDLISIRGGVIMTNVHDAPRGFFSDNDSKHGVSAGVGLEHFFGSTFSVGAGVMYNQMGFKNDSYPLFDITPVGKRPAAKLGYNYVSIPVKAGITLGHKHRFSGFAAIGIMPSILVRAVTKAPEYNLYGYVIGRESYNVTDQVSRFDLSELLEIGVNYRVDERYWVFSSILYQNSLTTLTNRDYFYEEKLRHYGLSISLGLKYKLEDLF